MSSIKTRKKMWQEMDIICLSLGNKTILIAINTMSFCRLSKYHFYPLNIYISSSRLKQVWHFFSRKNWEEGEKFLETISSYLKNSSSYYFAKFTFSLFQEKEAFPYLKESIEKKLDSRYDSEYLLYLELYSKMNVEEDLDSLKELLEVSKKRVAFSKNSYNGQYQEFKKLLEENRLEDAYEVLKKCIQMKPSIHLEISKKLLENIIKNQAEILEKQRRQEQKLESDRCEKFITLVKEKKYEEAKEQIELILAYRNLSNKNNYVYQLFWELLEMITVFAYDISFEILEVDYTYQKEKDALYTFREAISIGDFKKALEVGKKCSRKAVDISEPKLKVNLYLSMLNDFFERLEERKKDRDHIYKVVQNNIKRGHYIHALELYEKNKIALRNYQEALLLDLFMTGIALEKKETITVEPVTIEQLSLDADKKKEAVETPKNKVEEVPASEEKESNLEENKEEPFYPVEPLLNHLYPTHEYFTYFGKCLGSGQYEEAKYWLNQYGHLLQSNQVDKRLDYYYYQTETLYMESMEKSTSKKEELYCLAYSAMRNYHYEQAIIYLNYYQKMDTCRNNKGFILKGYIYSKMGKYSLAIEEFIHANAISPNPDAYYFLGDIYYQQHKWKDAIFCYITYNEFFPKENITVYLNLSECYKKINNSAKSLKYLKIAEELNQSQKKGLSLHNRLVRAEMLHQKTEKFHLVENSNNIT